MSGIERILRGILKYHANVKNDMVKQFRKVKDNPQPKAVMFTCMDSRLLMSKLLQTDVGDVFVVRNAGNLVPNNNSVSFDTITTEPGALEFCCVINDIHHVLVCGHSDCKAMHALFGLRDSLHIHEGSPLQLWVKRHGASSVAKYNELMKVGGVGPVTFQAETPSKTFTAYIDPENKFVAPDKFSQLNTLQQLQNIASYSFLADKLQSDSICLHALWFDVHAGDFYMFSRSQQRFLNVTEENWEHFVADNEKPKS